MSSVKRRSSRGVQSGERVELIKLRIAIGQLANLASSQISEINGLFSVIMVEESTLLVAFGGRGEKLGFPARELWAAESHIKQPSELKHTVEQFAVNALAESERSRARKVTFCSWMVKLESDFWFVKV